MDLPLPAIKGQWACDNAAVSICAVNTFLAGALPVAAIEASLRQVTMTGRMQIVEAEDTSVILDVAHNHAAAVKLCHYLTSEKVTGQTLAVFGCMQDKDAGAIVESLSAVVDRWFIAEIDYPRAMAGAEIDQELQQHGVKNTQIFASVIHAVNAAVAQSGTEDRVVVLGSFHVVGPALEALGEVQAS